MSYKKYTIIFIFLFGAIFILASLFRFLNPVKQETLSVIPTNIPIETDIITAFERTIEERHKVQVKILEKYVCYWIKTTHNGTHHLLQINEYMNTAGKCLGAPKNRYYINYENTLIVLGDTCICGEETYFFNWENEGIKIIKG